MSAIKDKKMTKAIRVNNGVKKMGVIFKLKIEPVFNIICTALAPADLFIFLFC